MATAEIGLTIFGKRIHLPAYLVKRYEKIFIGADDASQIADEMERTHPEFRIRTSADIQKATIALLEDALSVHEAVHGKEADYLDQLVEKIKARGELR